MRAEGLALDEMFVRTLLGGRQDEVQAAMWDLRKHNMAVTDALVEQVANQYQRR